MIYYVEDDKNVRELAVYALSHAGIEVEGLADDEEFRAACARRRPDVVVLDIMLPGTEGLEILRRLRQTPGLSRVPVIMVTATSTELDILTTARSWSARFRYALSAEKRPAVRSPFP